MSIVGRSPNLESARAFSPFLSVRLISDLSLQTCLAHLQLSRCNDAKVLIQGNNHVFVFYGRVITPHKRPTPSYRTIPHSATQWRKNTRKQSCCWSLWSCYYTPPLTFTVIVAFKACPCFSLIILHAPVKVGASSLLTHGVVMDQIALKFCYALQDELGGWVGGWVGVRG
jgi:hypothetical protein